MIDQLLRHHSPLRAWQGACTAELVQTPGAFGLGRLPARVAPEATAKAICGFCSTGCGLTVHLREGQAVNLTPDHRYPVNLGMACPKGWEALTPLAAADRATTPLLRDQSGALQPVDWNTAALEFCRRMKAVQEAHGAHAAAFLSTGQIATEEMAFLGAFAKFGMGMLQGDGNTRQCMATAVTAYKQSFGFDAPPYTYADFEESDVIVLVGSNLCIAHPIMWQRVMRNRRQPAIIVVDPRATETAGAATLHLAIRPKSDLVLFYGLAAALIARGCVDEHFVQQSTSGFADFRQFVEQFQEEHVLKETGLAAGDFRRFVDLVAGGFSSKRVSFWWTMGVNQSHQATRTAQAIINCALLMGAIGHPGSGANSITGQCNAMGSRLFSNTTNLLGGHDFTKPEHREKIARILGIDASRIPNQPSLAYDEILQAVEDGRIRALWIIATNPAHSWIGSGRWLRLREKLEFLVVQDMYASTETARLADLVLPAAGWGEKEGTFINSERRIGRIVKVAKAPGQALADFRIFQLLAHHWGCGEMFQGWRDPEAVFRILQEISRGQPCDITGIAGYAELEERGGVQWPCREGGVDAATERRLFADGRFYHPDGRARFLFDLPAPLPEPPDAAYPFLLNTGRGSSAQWHTGTRTEKSDILRKLRPPGPIVEIHPSDAARLGLVEDEAVKVRTRRASLLARARLTPAVPRGHLFLAMHDARVNRLTLEVVDPHSRQPAYKACAACVEKIKQN